MVGWGHCLRDGDGAGCYRLHGEGSSCGHAGRVVTGFHRCHAGAMGLSPLR